MQPISRYDVFPNKQTRRQTNEKKWSNLGIEGKKQYFLSKRRPNKSLVVLVGCLSSPKHSTHVYFSNVHMDRCWFRNLDQKLDCWEIFHHPYKGHPLEGSRLKIFAQTLPSTNFFIIITNCISMLIFWRFLRDQTAMTLSIIIPSWLMRPVGQWKQTWSTLTLDEIRTSRSSLKWMSLCGETLSSFAQET